MSEKYQKALLSQLGEVAVSMHHSAGAYMVPGWDGYKMAGLLEDALAELDKLLAERDELRARVQELGSVARENRSRAAVKMEAELDKLRADLERTERNRDMWKEQCARQAEQLMTGTLHLNAAQADARRYNAFFAAGLPITYLGQPYYTKADLDAAIDATTAEGGDGGAE